MSSKFCADRIIALKNSEFTPTCEDSRWDHGNINVYLRNNTKAPESGDRRRRVLIKPPSSIVLFPTRKLLKNEKLDRKSFENEEFKFYASPHHATTCMLHAFVFAASCPHGTVPMKAGGRIALQIQIERQKKHSLS